MKEFENIILHLSLIDGIGSSTIDFLVNSFGSSFEKLKKIYDFSINDFIEKGFSENLSKKLRNGLLDKTILEKEIYNLEKNKTTFISKFNSNYSFLLNETGVAPAILYIKSEANIDLNSNPVLAGVSSRQTNLYGKKAIDSLIGSLKDSSVFLISGGAIGGDTLIHEAAIKNNLKTAAIIGSGINYLYPASNGRLFDKILYSGGYIISPFSMDTAANKGTFPARNGIIAGMANATLVIQAAKKSGTLITAERALQFSREVGAVPGNFNDEFSIGCHCLIKSGAMLIDSQEDLFNLLSIKSCKKNTQNSSESTLKRVNILNICKEAKFIDEIVEKINIDKSELNIILFDLMTENKIKMDILGKWIAE